MKNCTIFTIPIFILSISTCYGQLSPGDLSSAHAKYEGMSNCTLCHDLGDKVSNSKCLDCHKEIKQLINQDRSYHASSEVKAKDCFDCHSDHHGRKFEMARFDQDKFDHYLADYKLSGKHAAIDCRDCHTSENIRNGDIKKRENTFLGLDQKCLSCHDDFHQNTLSNDCIECHNMEAFSPAPHFDHNETDFNLLDGHLDVDCKLCHKLSTKNGSEFQEFSGVGFNDCVVCHTDPHNDHFESECAMCHTEKSFSNFIGRSNFDHNTTDFTLKGKHNSIDCFTCHDRTSDPNLVFQNQPNLEENECASCHTDQHAGKFGDDCAQCHQEVSFLSLKSMDFFDHSTTDYPLDGKHGNVDCKQCHEESFIEAIDFSACNNCHQDYHRGEFQENNLSPDCIECHSLSEGFEYSLYTIEQHQSTSFPIEGAHIATPCFACHVSEDRWTFRDLGSSCVECHQDLHKGFIQEQYYPENNCEACHSDESWASINFNHNLTNWPLEGRHLEVNCRDCHFENVTNLDTLYQRFSDLDNSCVQCHENIHVNTIVTNVKNDCIKCHDPASWLPKIDHNETAFPLEGVHAQIECKACHNTNRENGKVLIEFKIGKFECIDCHY